MDNWVALICSLIGKTIMSWLTWTEQRLREPSTWAGVGCALVGIGVINQVEIVVFIGIAVGGIAMLVREKGKE